MSRPFVVGVDLDGVCADYVDAFRAFVAMRKNVSINSIGPATDWEFHKVDSWPIADRAEYMALHKAFVADGGYVMAPMIHGASAALWELSHSGFYIRIITHRLINSGEYEDVVGQTARWLKAKNIPFRGLAFERHKADVGCDIYIDDSPGNIAELRAAGKETITFDAPYNRDQLVGRGYRALSWHDVVRIVKHVAAVTHA